MNLITRGAFLGLMIFFFAYSYGQKDKGSTTVITFDDDKSSFDEYNSSTSFGRNVVKFDLFAIAIGDYSLYYERALNAKFGAELGLGITRRNYVYIFFNDILNDNTDITNHTGDFQINYLNGTTFKFGLKYYPGAYAPEDFYIQLQYAMRQYKEEYTFVNASSLINTETMPVERIYHEARLIFGSADYMGNSDHWMSDYFIGVGAKFRSYNDVKSREVLLNGPNGSSSSHEFYTTVVQDVTFAVYLGWKFGFGF